jgi:hypothetical protein
MTHHVYMAQHGATEQVHTAMQQSQKQTGGEGVTSPASARAATHPHPYKIFAKRDSAPCSTLKVNCHFLSIGCWHSKVAFIWPHVLA